jgi:hypothetical protein
VNSVGRTFSRRTRPRSSSGSRDVGGAPHNMTLVLGGLIRTRSPSTTGNSRFLRTSRSSAICSASRAGRWRN